MSNITGYITLKQVVHNFRMMNKEYGNMDDDRLLLFAANALMDFKRFKSRKVKVKYYDSSEISDINTISLPRDYDSFSKLGEIHNERVLILTENKNIAIPGKIENGVQSRDVDKSNSNNEYFVAHDHNGQYIQNLYGLRGGYYDLYYKLDENHERIILEGDASSSLILEYISTGIDMDQDTVIPIRLLNVLIRRMEWEIADRDPTVPDYLVRRKQHYYAIEEARAGKLEHRWNIEQFRAAMWSSSSRGLKR